LVNFSSARCGSRIRHSIVRFKLADGIGGILFGFLFLWLKLEEERFRY
jgi:hypothetical protein